MEALVAKRTASKRKTKCSHSWHPIDGRRGPLAVRRPRTNRELSGNLIAEADAFVAQWKDGNCRMAATTSCGGHGPQRAIQTGVGPVEVRRAKVRDRADVEADQKIRFTSAILPKWARRTKSLDALLGQPISGRDHAADGEWQADCDAWRKRDLSGRRYVYAWADGV
jgi:putative transposase